MKKIAVWAFIFTVLSVSTYATLALTNTPRTVDAFQNNQNDDAVLVFKTSITKTLKIRQLTFHYKLPADNVCVVSKDFANGLNKKDYGAHGFNKYGVPFYEIQSKVSQKILSTINPNQCHVEEITFLRWFMSFVGGGQVS